MAGVSIRLARTDDAAAVAGLIGQLGYSTTADDVVSRLPAMESVGADAIVAEVDGTVVGCLTMSVMRVLHRPAPVGRISMMVVDQAHRSRGVGEKLVRAAEQALAARQCYMVEVTSRFELMRAHGFYERLGYERTSVRLARLLDPTS